jgi:hypothetical protein
VINDLNRKARRLRDIVFFYGRDGYLQSKSFKKIEALEVTMEKHNINLDYSSSNSSSHGHTIYASSISFNVAYFCSSNEWLIDFGASYHMAKNKAIFSSLNECNTKQIFVGDDRSLNVVGFGTVHLECGHFNDVL